MMSSFAKELHFYVVNQWDKSINDLANYNTQQEDKSADSESSEVVQPEPHPSAAPRRSARLRRPPAWAADYVFT
jgi:hypothetical protein